MRTTLHIDDNLFTLAKKVAAGSRRTLTAVVEDALRQALTPLAARIDWAFVYGSMARAEAVSESDIDLMVIGQLGLAELTPVLRRAEQQVGRPINPTLYRPEEWNQKRQQGHPFLLQVLQGEKLFLLGNPDELAIPAGR